MLQEVIGHTSSMIRKRRVLTVSERSDCAELLVAVLSEGAFKKVTNQYGPHKMNRIVTFGIPGTFNASVEVYSASRLAIKYWAKLPGMPQTGNQEFDSLEELMCWLYAALRDLMPKAEEGSYHSFLQEV
jgi:hypothetical protein